MAEPAAAPVPTKELPPEVWNLILSNLDEPSLMTCRLVNKSWRDRASKLLSESISFWTVTFEYRSGRRTATHFSTPGEITRFMSDMKKSKNPFPNGTVIFTPANPDRIKDFQAKSCELLEAFGDSIVNLVYRRVESILTYQHLPEILQLKNLKRLQIQSLDWGSFNFPLDNSNLQVAPEKLTEVIIQGRNGAIPLSYLFGGIQSTPKSLSTLTVSNNSTIDLPHQLCQLPSLKRLKVLPSTVEFLSQFQQFQPNCIASLKEVSLDFKNLWMNLLDFEIFRLLDYQAESLELLNLSIGKLPLEAVGLNTSVKYRKLKTLALELTFEALVWQPVLIELMEKLMNLQEFRIVIPAPVPGFVLVPGVPNHRTPRDRYEIVRASWNHLPASVKVISFPLYGWKIKRGETLQFNDAGEQVE